MQITPGYNFEPNEVPTKAKLGLMTTGMQLRGIDISQINTNLIGYKTNGDTSVSLPGEGWLQVSPQGALWVKTRWGRVMWYRAGWGGFETIRYRAIRSVTLAGFALNRPCSYFGQYGSNATHESNTGFLFNTPGGNNVDTVQRALETGQTNVNTRFLLWGGSVTPSEHSLTAATWVRKRLFSMVAANVPAQDYDGAQSIPQSSAVGSATSHGIFVASQTAPSATVAVLGWHYGLGMFKK